MHQEEARIGQCRKEEGQAEEAIRKEFRGNQGRERGREGWERERGREREGGGDSRSEKALGQRIIECWKVFSVRLSTAACSWFPSSVSCYCDIQTEIEYPLNCTTSPPSHTPQEEDLRAYKESYSSSVEPAYSISHYLTMSCW